MIRRLILTLALPLALAAAGFPNHQHLVVANAAHGIMGYPELNPLMLAFLRGERITQLRASFPKWDLKHPAQR